MCHAGLVQVLVNRGPLNKSPDLSGNHIKLMDVSGDENTTLQNMIYAKKRKSNGNYKSSYTVSKTQRSMVFFILRVF